MDAMSWAIGEKSWRFVGTSQKVRDSFFLFSFLYSG